MTIAQRLRTLYDNLVISLNFINTEIVRKADKVLLKETSTYTLGFGCIYDLGTVNGSTITLSSTGVITDECPEWHFFFTAGANAPLWAQTITWTATPTFTEGKRYEVSIILVDSTYDGVVLEKEDAE